MKPLPPRDPDLLDILAATVRRYPVRSWVAIILAVLWCLVAVADSVLSLLLRFRPE